MFDSFFVSIAASALAIPLTNGSTPMQPMRGCCSAWAIMCSPPPNPISRRTLSTGTGNRTASSDGAGTAKSTASRGNNVANNCARCGLSAWPLRRPKIRLWLFPPILSHPIAIGIIVPIRSDLSSAVFCRILDTYWSQARFHVQYAGIMARRVHDKALDSRDARRRLKIRGKPYYRALERGLHLGYRRLGGGQAGTW